MPGTNHDFRLGVLMLKTRFPRPPGDIGNAETFPFETFYEVIEAATVDRIVTPDGATSELVEAFIAGGHRLLDKGAQVIATSCGFLYPHQEDLARALPCPVASSALCLLPLLRQSYGAQSPIGILTFEAEVLSGMLQKKGDSGLIIEGIPRKGALYAAIKNDQPSFDAARAEQDCIDAASALMSRAPDIKALLLECTNLPPHRASIAEACGVPVYDIRDLVFLLARGLRRGP